MKNTTITISERGLQNLHKFLGRAELKGHEVPEFVQLLQELRPIDEAGVAPAKQTATTPSPSR